MCHVITEDDVIHRDHDSSKSYPKAGEASIYARTVAIVMAIILIGRLYDMISRLSDLIAVQRLFYI